MDPLNNDQLHKQRKAVKQKMEDLARKGGSPDDLRKVEKYLKLIDRRIERSEQAADKKEGEDRNEKD